MGTVHSPHCIRLAAVLCVPVLLIIAGCAGSCASDPAAAARTTTTPGARASDASRTYPLDSLTTSTLTIDSHAFRIWLAQEFDPRRPSVTQEGLMYVPTSEIADDQGMLFVFPDEAIRGFWMKNTIAPLDIAFARMDGTIVKIWQMPPLTLQTYSSIEPAMFALEVKQGTFARLGIKEGDVMQIPQDVFATSP